MADKEQDDGPSLELPSLGFGRKRRRRREEADPEPAPEPEEAAAPPSPEADTTVTEPVAPEPERTEVLPPVAAEVTEPAARPLFTDEQRAQAPVEVEEAEEVEEADESPSGPRGGSLPALGGVPAALVTGLLVGAVLVGLVWASMRGCELVSGTSSCGNAGFLLLLAALVLAGVLGAALLRGFGASDAGSTSALGTGLVAVVLLLVLGDRLFAWWMVIAVPLVAMVTFGLSRAVTTAFVDTTGDDTHR